MAKLISIHEYILNENVTGMQFEKAIEYACSLGLFDLPGLIDHRFLKYIRGTRQVQYAAIWIYADRESWEKLWGPVNNPIKKEDYPGKWKIWENEILTPLLAQDPDKIYFASFEEL
jgi:hypothetical protein